MCQHNVLTAKQTLCRQAKYERAIEMYKERLGEWLSFAPPPYHLTLQYTAGGCLHIDGSAAMMMMSLGHI